ncbi:YCII-related domain protein [Aspergillus nomiae NRRL 13137]|uniref:YCII-related domain protein n=1 Tax=Aspergillus nomiae NRRL (strain ATCC 15546 / NRRL 13137 / CBS 260.88 / M93) TaxID=1509407 RepID=A0A0L1J2D3_ASPN3|nr:YCII-related domain protein [Aspergillus nomiae NRRL 13137]KNG85840.1 YCII-related domain protein [Aspergillus nomiae NRRL 13137]
MSTKKEFICLVPDKPDALQKRLDVRGQHLEGVRPLVANGTVVCGGGTVDSHPGPGETPSFNGSALIVLAESEAEVRELIAKDIYARSGVWDVEKAQVIPFMCAVRVGNKALP